MGRARMQLVRAVSTSWETGAWPGTGARFSLETQMGLGKVAWGRACPGGGCGFCEQ